MPGIKIIIYLTSIILSVSTPVFAGDSINYNTEADELIMFEPPEGEMGNPGDIDLSAAKGSPVWTVNKINMNFYVTDIPIWYSPSIGPGVYVQLSYNSKGDKDPGSAFGNKWFLNYGSYIAEDFDDNKTTVHMPDGRKDVYTGIGSYTNPYGVFNTLTKIAEDHFELKLQDGTVFVYRIPFGTTLGRPYLVEIRDPYYQYNQNLKLTINYNGNNQLETITDAAGKVTKFTYNAEGLVARIDERYGEPSSRYATFEYDTADGKRNLRKITDMSGYWTTYNYQNDYTVFITGITNEKGSWGIDIEPQAAILATGSGGNRPRPSMDTLAGAGAIYVRREDPLPVNVYRITIDFTPAGAPEPLTKEEYYYYGACTWHVSPKDYVEYVDENINNYRTAPKTKYCIDRSSPKPKLLGIQYPEGGYVEYGYDTATGRPSSITDYHGEDGNKQDIKHTTYYTYNSNGLPTSITDARGKTTTYTYYPNNIDLWKITNTLGTIEYTYNGDTHDIATIKDRLNNITAFTYNAYGQLQTITEAQGAALQSITDLIYDPTSHNLTEIKKAGSTLASFTHDNIGRIATLTDPTGLTLGYKYNNLDQTTKILYPDTVYDANQNPLSKFINIIRSACCLNVIDSITDRGGLTTTYTHDALKRLTNVTGPAGIYDFEYDANGNMTKLKDSNRTPAAETTFEYNLDNLLAKKTYADGKFWTYIYDKAGLLKTFTNSRNISKNYNYDQNHNLLNIDYSDTTPDVSFTYDDYNRPVTRVDGIGTTTYGYDANNRLTSVDGQLTNDTITYQYNELGQTTNVTPDGGQALLYSYDPIGRLTTILKGTDSFVYGYAGVNPLIQSLTRPNGSITEYTYNDPLKKLTDVINKNSTAQVINSFNYTYYTSGAGTDLIQTETITNSEAIDNFVAGTTTYTPNNLNQLVSTSNPNQTFTYDDDGNMTQGYTPEGYLMAMTYDAENRMTSAEYTDSNNVIHRTEYTYSGDSLLAQVKKFDNGILTSDIRYVRDDFLVLQERDANNNIDREYTWGIDIGGGIEGLLNLKQGGVNYNYLYDGKGNVAALIDNNQSIVAAYSYDPFGVLMKKSGIFNQHYMFSTKQYDPQTGFSMYEYRVYSAIIGKWLTRDPLGEYGGYNLYRAMNNSAMNWIDPWGLYESPQLLRATVPGQIAYDNGRTALENKNYFEAGVHFAAMLGEQVLTVLTFGESAALKQGTQCLVNTAARTIPKNLAEQLALEEAKSGAGEEIMEGLIKDPNFPIKLWAKMQYVHKSLDGSKIAIHYWKNRISGATQGFKFK